MGPLPSRRTFDGWSGRATVGRFPGHARSNRDPDSYHAVPSRGFPVDEESGAFFAAAAANPDVMGQVCTVLTGGLPGTGIWIGPGKTLSRHGWPGNSHRLSSGVDPRRRFRRFERFQGIGTGDGRRTRSGSDRTADRAADCPSVCNGHGGDIARRWTLRTAGIPGARDRSD